jgi:putative lipoprotein
MRQASVCTRSLTAAASLLACLLSSKTARADDEWLGRDKFLHFGVSAAIAGTGYAVSSLVFDERWQRATAGGSTALAAGAAKELYDLGGAGDASWKDFAWDVAGAAVGVGVAFAIDLALGKRSTEQTDTRGLAVSW